MTSATPICNLWHIKRTNGLFYYALDYLRAQTRPAVVVVRKELLEATRAELPNHDVRAVGGGGFLLRMAGALMRGRFVFTPTSHPFPFLRRQLVVIHDDFPFLGKTGSLKRHLFEFGLRSSGCDIGHINHSTSLDALRDRDTLAARLRYMPNKGPAPGVAQALRVARAAAVAAVPPIRIALFGSDSPKKHYEDLFGSIRAKRLATRVRCLVYGHATPYLDDLRARFADLDIELVTSAAARIEDFLAGADLVASVARHEGFGRPIALALSAGIPCFLLESPVFREFFGRSTRLYQDVDSLVDDIGAFSADRAQDVRFVELAAIGTAFDAAVAHLDTHLA